MTDFLLELLSEEIPARMQAGARADLERLFRREMDAAGVSMGEITVWSTPRRLALIAKDLPAETEAVSEEAKGPPEGAPDEAIDGFCRKNGVTRDQLELRDVKGRQTLFAVIDKPGRAVKDVLAEAIPAIIRDFPWPKSMRWGAASVSTGSLRWVRPLSGIVAIFGEDLVECEVDGVRSGYSTLGHRFHCPGEITIGGADDYAEKLRACHVIVDHEERQDLIRAKASEAAAAAWLKLVEDEGLVVENAGLTEWPVPLLGRFDAEYLDVPPEVIQLTARTNQKYFVCTGSPAKAGASGGDAQPNEVPASAGTQDLANAFICTANIAAEDPEVVVDGNRKVLAARLSDARFFWEQDRKTKLEDHAKKLERITFHEKLGTVADKVERVAKLARWLVEEGIIPPRNGEGDHAKHGGGARADGATPQGSSTPNVPLHRPADGPPPPAGEDREHLANLAEQAARLCKADLVTEMVGEFPELQGLMGGYYARAEGLPDEVADAIRDHYKPVGQGDDVPTAPVTVAVSLADKLDSLFQFFRIDERPTGSKDPFALRRAALGIISIILRNELRFRLLNPIEYLVDEEVLKIGSGVWPPEWDEKTPEFKRAVAFRIAIRPAEDAILDFIADRLKVQQREAGVRHDLIDAVFALGNEDDLVRLLSRVKALQSFVGTDDGENLLAAYKRAANILKKEDWHGIEGEIAQTGDEDPLSLVDDPDLKPVIAAKMAEAHKRELSYTLENAEKALIDALDSAEPQADAAVAAEDFSGAMAALASLRAPIDRFFDEVTVNDENPDKRASRLDLLARFRAAVHKVADFSKIEG